MNALYCPHCHTVIVSIRRHDFVGCECPRESGTWVAVDGGEAYTRVIGNFRGPAPALPVIRIRTIDADLEPQDLARRRIPADIVE